MKISHIVAIIAVAIGIGVVVSTAGNASTYVNFEQANKMASEGDDAKVHLIGSLVKDAEGHVQGVVYNPQVDPNYLGFTLKDEAGKIQQVICNNPPASMQDFFRSEKVVVIGRMQEGTFVASEVLMKCPSKYEETQLKK
jgi:cytochrome c-type biogenesis protein CcmE